MKKLLFQLGAVVATPGALALLNQSNTNPADLLRRHQCGDWGDVPAEDFHANGAAVRYRDRILSSYDVGTHQRIWIITEADRSTTTLLLPEDY
jgi:hypothetical protein